MLGHPSHPNIHNIHNIHSFHSFQNVHFSTSYTRLEFKDDNQDATEKKKIHRQKTRGP